MSRFVLVVALALVLAPPAAARQAPGAPGEKHTWAPADKHGFATARQLGGNAYLTLRATSLSEVYFPDLSTPAFRGLQFAVAGDGFLDREVVDDDPSHIEPTAPGVTSRIEPLAGSLGFTQVTETARWRLSKVWITDPARATVLACLRFDSKTGAPLRLYALADPAPGDDGDDDRAVSGRARLTAWDDDAASVVAAAPALRQTGSGYRGTRSDTWRQLRRSGRRRADDARRPGNVVQGALTRLNGTTRTEMTLAIGFGRTRAKARRTTTASLRTGFAGAATRYANGWSNYLQSLDDPPASVASDPFLRQVYDQSLLVLAASEDKVHRGASIAAPGMPWVWGTLTLEDKAISGPYHLVWPRDFYHVATAQKAAGDDAAAARLLDFLWRVQKRDGSWWQNTRVNGRKFWTELQMDEVALPIVLAWWLGRTGRSDRRHVSAAADFIVANGSKTGQERWENQDGWSPNTIATEIAGLVCAAAIARSHGERAKAVRYERVADRWERRVEGWTATTNGPYSPTPYYLRVTKDGKPDRGTEYPLGDNRIEDVDQRAIVDNSFLALVLFGVKPWNDPTVLNSLAVGDAQLAADTPSGRIWHRFTFDGYGEKADGGDWDIFDPPREQTFGRVWPLLTGERGEYELIAGRDASSHLRTIANTANDGLMLPEQAWDGRAPLTEPVGSGTRSATPLAWTHAQFVRLAWSIDAGAPVERPAVVACRYTGELC